MNIRSILATAFIFGIFSVFLFWLYSIGKVSILGIVAIISVGAVLITLTHYFYKKIWSESE